MSARFPLGTGDQTASVGPADVDLAKLERTISRPGASAAWQSATSTVAVAELGNAAPCIGDPL